MCSCVCLLSVKPSKPELIVHGSTDNSLDVAWISTGESSCQLRYRANGTYTWRQVASLNYTLTHKFMSNCLLFNINERRAIPHSPREMVERSVRSLRGVEWWHFPGLVSVEV